MVLLGWCGCLVSAPAPAQTSCTGRTALLRPGQRCFPPQRGRVAVSLRHPPPPLSPGEGRGGGAGRACGERGRACRPRAALPEGPRRARSGGRAGPLGVGGARAGGGAGVGRRAWDRGPARAAAGGHGASGRAWGAGVGDGRAAARTGRQGLAFLVCDPSKPSPSPPGISLVLEKSRGTPLLFNPRPPRPRPCAVLWLPAGRPLTSFGPLFPRPSGTSAPQARGAGKRGF